MDVWDSVWGIVIGVLIFAGFFYFLINYLTKGDKIAREIKNSKERTEKNAEPIELPCKIKITRPKSFSGSLTNIHLYLNGNFVGELKNGTEIEFQTSILDNELTLMEDNGYTGPKPFKFTAIPGEEINYTLLFPFTLEEFK